MVKYSSLGGMAQLVEHSLHMRGVTGSSPVVSTNNPIVGLFFVLQTILYFSLRKQGKEFIITIIKS